MLGISTNDRVTRSSAAVPCAPQAGYCQELLPGRCHHCRRGVVFVRVVKGTNHMLHGLLSLLTGGIWLPVWIAALLRADAEPWECAECGRRRRRIKPPPAVNSPSAF